MRPEQHGGEGRGRFFGRSKLGLETPLSGRLWRETRLTFAPPAWYDTLTIGCIVFGSLMFLSEFVRLPFFPQLLPDGVGLAIYPMVAVAGLWGQLSNERMTCDLRTRKYTRREGQGLFKRVSGGSLDELDALVLLAEHSTFPNPLVVYRLVLHWKGSRLPLLIVEQEAYGLSFGAQLNSRAAPLIAKGQTYARLLQITFYDNSYFHSPEPLPPI